MLFVYGTLQDPDVLSAVLGRPLSAETLLPATAPDFRAVHYPGRVYPALVHAKGHMAQGHVLGDLDAQDLRVLDAFEGDEYLRRAIAVHVDGRILRVEAYLPAIDIASDGPTWTLAEWEKRHKAHVIAEELAVATAIRSRLAKAND